MVMLTYLLSNPFLDWKLNFLEIFNEVLFLMCIYHMYAFSNLVNSEEQRYDIGLSAIFLVIVNFVTNIGHLIYLTFRQLTKCFNR